MQAQDLPESHTTEQESGGPLEKGFWRESAPGAFSAVPNGQVVCCDALDLLSSLKDESVDLLFLDPPFNLGKDYGAKGKEADLLEESEYLNFMQSILNRGIETLKPGGALYMYHLPRWAFRFASLLEAQLEFRHWIAISMKNGFARGDSLYPAHYALLYFTKGSPASFERPKIDPKVCRHCGKYIKDYGGYKQYVENGINLSDVWDDLSPVRHQKNKTRKANELPYELVRRVLRISGFPGGLFVDPFAGSGTSLVAAQNDHMLFVAGDYEQENCDTILQRLGYEIGLSEEE